MKVTIKESIPKMLETFLSYLTKRAADPIHENSRDMIADFVEQFIVVEMKLPDTEQPYDREIEVSDDVYKKPLELAQKQVEVYKTFLNKVLKAQESIALTAREFLNKGVSQDVFSLDSTEAQINVIDKALAKEDVQDIVTTPSAAEKRNGNGHKSLKVRDLTNGEKDIIRAMFVDINGEITEDACKPIHARLDPVVSIAQVTGRVSYHHNQVASGQLQVNDLQKYLTFIQSHRDLWATYNSPKYQALRGGKKI